MFVFKLYNLYKYFLMSKKLLFAFLAFVLCGTQGSIAQQTRPVMKFDEQVHDFGTFKEETGKATHSFSFINKGDQPIIINNVRSSCGCTTPEWSRQPVPPGGKGFIKATYDPRNRPGPFNKSITITSNTKSPVHILRIKGQVTPRVKTMAELFPRMMDGLRLQNNHLSFTKVKNTQQKEASLNVINDSDKPISVTFERVPAHITLKMVPKVLKPKEKGEIVAVYDASKKSDWGFVIDYLNVRINNKDYNPRNRLAVSANIVEDFTQLSSSDMAKAPHVEFMEKVFDFGSLKQGDKAEHIFVMKNSGKTDLVIRKTKASCGCTAITPLKKVLKPGEESNIKVVFNSRGKRGRQNKLITVITNDPKDSSVKLRVTGNVLMPHSN